MPHTIPELTIVIPTFNERENIKLLYNALSHALSGIEWEALVVDDDSPDGTAEYVRSMMMEFDNIRCIQRIGRRGLSSACIEGMLASASPYLAVIDADLQHDEAILPKMLAEAKQNDLDLVVGSRYVDGGSTGKLNPLRVFISRVASYLGRIILKSPVTDPMSGFFLLRRDYFERVVHNLSGKGFKFLLDLIVSAHCTARYSEVPYTMRARQCGTSKLDTLVVWEYITLIADKLIGNYIPFRFVMFVGVGCLGMGVHLAVLALMYQNLRIDFLLSQFFATLIAMTNNFILNNQFTYRDQRLLGPQFIKGLFSFYFACSVGAAINIQLATFVYYHEVPWWISGLIGALVGSVWNYAITASFTWNQAGFKRKVRG